MNNDATYLLRLPRRTLDALQDLAIKKSRSTMPRRKITVKDLINAAIIGQYPELSIAETSDFYYLKGVER